MVTRAAAGSAVLAAVALALALAPAPAAAQPVPAALPGTEQRTVIARHGGEYRVFIARPKAPPPAAGYPVLYALDGNAAIAPLAGLLLSHGGRNDHARFEPGIVVAVGYPTGKPLDMERRAMDYTPAPATPGSGTYLTPEATGGADRFLDFIENELKPALERDLPIDRSRQAIFGHSFGGLFALHALFTRPQAFQTYVAASPSIWWADRAILGSEKAFAAGRAPLPGTRLLVMVGGQEQELDPALAAAPDAAEIAARLGSRRMVDEARGLATRLSALKERGLAVSFEEIAGETHGSVIPFAVIKGFRFALRPKS